MTGTISSEVGTNGSNGYHSSDVRKSLVSLAVFGSISDAKEAFLAIPGASLEAWTDFERALLPVRAYVREGEAAYVRPLVGVDIWQGVETPQGDCQEESLPVELQNPRRRALEKEWFEKKEQGRV